MIIVYLIVYIIVYVIVYIMVYVIVYIMVYIMAYILILLLTLDRFRFTKWFETDRPSKSAHSQQQNTRHRLNP